MPLEITGRDRLTVARPVDDEAEADLEMNGQHYEELEVFNHVSVAQYHYVNSVNGHETFEPEISKGDMGGGSAPEYVTERIADYLWHEFNIEVEDHGIEVIDPEADDVEVA